jgi:phosphoadenosine phosphosulfate reductase
MEVKSLPSFLHEHLSQPQFPGWRESLIEASIATLKFYEPKDAPYWGCFSGGKDSIVIKELAAMAEVNVEWNYSVTTLDPPELTQFIKRYHPDVNRNIPEKTFLQLVPSKGMPTRIVRWCCEKLKESRAPKGRRLILGIRAAESPRRAKNWQTFTYHRRQREYAVCPVLHWQDSDVWSFIIERDLPYCKLYDLGYERIGCIMCPMASGKNRLRESKQYPTMMRQIKRAAIEYWEKNKRDGKDARTYRAFDTGEQFWDWWLKGDSLPNEECQGDLELWQ